MSDGFKITYQMTRADYQAMVAEVLRKPLWYRLVLVAGMISAWLASVLYASTSMDQFWRFIALVFSGRAYWAVYLAPFAILMLFFWETVMAFLGSFTFSRNVLAKKPTTVTADAQEIRLGVEGLSSTVRWDAITKLIETRKHLLLMLATQQAVVLPRRAFASEADYAAARALALAQVSPDIPKRLQ